MAFRWVFTALPLEQKRASPEHFEVRGLARQPSKNTNGAMVVWAPSSGAQQTTASMLCGLVLLRGRTEKMPNCARSEHRGQPCTCQQVCGLSIT